MSEQEIYQTWLGASTPEDKARLEDQLLAALSRHGHAVVWLEMHDRRPEIVNEALYRAYRGLKKFRGDSKISTWFHTIVVNLCKRERKREGRRREVPLEAASATRAGEAVSYDVGKLFESLNPEDREFAERKLANIPDDALAEHYGLSNAGVRSRWHRIKKQLLKSLG